MMEQGYAIAATDYPGLGTPGPHPYLVGVSEARAVINSVRAARTSRHRRRPLCGVGSFAGRTGRAVHGLDLGELRARTEAARCCGSGAGDRSRNADDRRPQHDRRPQPYGHDGVVMVARLRRADWQHRRSSAVPTIDRLAEECIESPFDIFRRGRTAAPLAEVFLTTKNPAEVEPWHSLLLRNTPGLLPRGLPLFLAQGSGDDWCGRR